MIYEKPEWEKVVRATYRMKVPGGWIVFNSSFKGMVDHGVALCYVPDPGHAWQWLPEEAPND